MCPDKILSACFSNSGKHLNKLVQKIRVELEEPKKMLNIKIEKLDKISLKLREKNCANIFVEWKRKIAKLRKNWIWKLFPRFFNEFSKKWKRDFTERETGNCDSLFGRIMNELEADNLCVVSSIFEEISHLLAPKLFWNQIRICIILKDKILRKILFWDKLTWLKRTQFEFILKKIVFWQKAPTPVPQTVKTPSDLKRTHFLRWQFNFRKRLFQNYFKFLGIKKQIILEKKERKNWIHFFE